MTKGRQPEKPETKGRQPEKPEWGGPLQGSPATTHSIHSASSFPFLLPPFHPIVRVLGVIPW